MLSNSKHSAYAKFFTRNPHLAPRPVPLSERIIAAIVALSFTAGSLAVTYLAPGVTFR